jgi:DNA-directed RNA polymerase subunit M/transcription elongation factor TFIIS
MEFPLSWLFYTENYNNNRRSISKLLGNILYGTQNFLNLYYTDQTDMIMNIEYGIYQEALKKSCSQGIMPSWLDPNFAKIYDIIGYKITANLDKYSMVGSDHLQNIIFESKIELKDIANMDSSELCLNRHIGILNKIISRKEEKMEYNFSKLIKCIQCKKYTCVKTTVQARSLDEPATTIYECINCRIKMR